MFSLHFEVRAQYLLTLGQMYTGVKGLGGEWGQQVLQHPVEQVSVTSKFKEKHSNFTEMSWESPSVL